MVVICRQQHGREGLELGLAPPVMVYTTPGAMVHHRSHHPFPTESEGSRIGHRRGHRHPMAVHRPIFPKSMVFMVLARVALPPPV